MAVGKRRNRPRNKTSSKKRTQKRSRRGSTRGRPQARSTFGNLIASGVRSAVTLLPGSTVLAPLADLVLTSLGYAPSVKPVNGKVKDTVTNIYGLGAKFAVSPVYLLYGSKAGYRLHTGSGTHGGDQKLLLDYNEARLIEVEVSVEPSGPVGSRTGQWTVGLYPFYAEDERTNFGLKRVPDTDVLKLAPYAVTGSASLPLTLRYHPKVTDGIAFGFGKPDSTRFGVCLRFDDYNRENYVDFKSEEFGVSLVMKGRVELRSAQVNVGSTLQDDNVRLYYAKLSNQLDGVTHCIESPNGCTLVNKSSSSVSDDGHSMRISGTIVKDITVDEELDAMVVV